MAADNFFYESFMSQMVEPALRAVALTGRVYETKIFRRSVFHESFFKCLCQFFRVSVSYEPTGCHHVSIFYERYGSFSCHDLRFQTVPSFMYFLSHLYIKQVLCQYSEKHAFADTSNQMQP